jgi:UDP-GlcNAc:undecaprenyl-phosphate GlcNAc-1-phosphate transferase
MIMTDFLPLIVVGFAASLGLTPLSRQIARRLGVMDAPSARKLQHAPIPLMGGLAIYGAFVLALLLFHPWGDTYKAELAAIIASATWLAFIGLVDDRIDLRPWVKFPAQALAAVIMISVGVQVQLFTNPLINWIVTFVWIVGIINAINFLDNMDGLAAGISAIAAFFMFLLSISQGQELVSALSAALCGSAIGFLIYNFNPATTFMGDMGSMVLGFVLAVLGIKLRFPTHTLAAGSWFLPILVLGLPIFDTTLVVFSRLREGRSPMQGGRDHTSHRLVVAGLSHRMAVIALYIVCIALGIAALVASQSEATVANMIAAVSAILGACAFVLLEAVHIRQQRSITQKPS